MSSLSSKDPASLCSFTFADGRRCRTPRNRNHPRFCFYHAQKEARARAAHSLGKDLAYFFSGNYLSACDLSAALGRLIPAVLRGDVKPRAARTVAYLAQILLQAIHISQHEYCEAFDADDWRNSIRNSVKGNHDYLFPAAKPEQHTSPLPQPASVAQPLRGEAVRSTRATSSAQPLTQAQQPAASHQTPPAPQSEIPILSGTAPSPHAPLPPTSAEFAQHVMAGLTHSVRPGSTGESAGGHALQPTPAQQSEIPILSGPATAPRSSPTQLAAAQSNPPQPAPVTQPFASLALPLPVRRRLHRAAV